jgi:hypothetical protein
MKLSILSILAAIPFAFLGAVSANATPIEPSQPQVQVAQNLTTQPGASYSNSSTDLSNKGVVEQRNSLSQSQYGSTMSNVQINNQNDSYIGFGPGIQSAVPTFNLSLWGSTDLNYGNFGGTMTFSVPLPTSTGKVHKRYVSAITATAEENGKQKVLQTDWERIDRCVAWASKGVDLSKISFCSDVQLSQPMSLSQEVRPSFDANSTIAPLNTQKTSQGTRALW